MTATLELLPFGEFDSFISASDFQCCAASASDIREKLNCCQLFGLFCLPDFCISWYDHNNIFLTMWSANYSDRTGQDRSFGRRTGALVRQVDRVSRCLHRGQDLLYKVLQTPEQPPPNCIYKFFTEAGRSGVDTDDA